MSPRNPFAFSHVVTGDSFCNRVREQARLMRYIESSQNVLLYSHRRIGKSSLIHQVFANIQSRKLDIGALYIDLFGTLSEKDFIIKTFHALNQLESNIEKLIQLIGKAVKSLRLNFSIESGSGNPVISPSFSAIEESKILPELMDLLDQYSKKRKLVIAFDEFQEIANYAEAAFEKRLRSVIQGHSNISYIFSGSRQHVVSEMFNSSNRAFYKLADSFPLEKIETKDYLPWIRERFNIKGILLDESLVTEIIDRFENHPMYIQQFLFHLWDETTADPVSTDILDVVESEMIARKAIEFSTLWETLSLNQKKTLKLILSHQGKNLYSAEALASVGLKSASLVTRSLSILRQKEIIAKNGHYELQDVMLKKWLRTI